MAENGLDRPEDTLTEREAFVHVLNVTNLNAVSTSIPTKGQAVTAYPYNRKTVYVNIDAGVGTAVVRVEASANKTDWVIINSRSVVAASTSYLFSTNDHHRFLRTVNTAVINKSTVSTIITGKGV